MCSPPLWEHFQLYLSSLAEGWDNTACWATCTQAVQQGPARPAQHGPGEPARRGGTPISTWASRRPTVPHIIKNRHSPKLTPEWSSLRLLPAFFSFFSEAFTHGHMQPGHDMRYISKQRSSEKNPAETVHLSRPRPYSHANCKPACVWELVVCFVPQHSPGWNVGLICYQSQLVFPADAHRPGVTQPHSCTSCAGICQARSLMPLTFGFAGLLQYAWQTLLVPRGLPGNCTETTL